MDFDLAYQSVLVVPVEDFEQVYSTHLEVYCFQLVEVGFDYYYFLFALASSYQKLRSAVEDDFAEVVLYHFVLVYRFDFDYFVVDFVEPYRLNYYFYH